MLRRSQTVALALSTLAFPFMAHAQPGPSLDSSGIDTLKAFNPAYDYRSKPLTGSFGAGLFEASVPSLPAPQAYAPAVLNDFRGLTADGNLAPGLRGPLGKPLHTMALAAADVTGDGKDDILTLQARSDHGWSDSARFVVYPAAGNGAFLAPRVTRLRAGRYSDMLRILDNPRAFALMKMTDTAYNTRKYALEIYPLASLACGSSECSAPAPLLTIPVSGTPTTVIVGDFNLDRVTDIAVLLQGMPGKIQVQLGAISDLGFPESGRRTLVTEGLVPLREQIPQNRLELARNMAAGPFQDSGAAKPDTLPDLVVATWDSTNWWKLEVFHNFAIDAKPKRKTLHWTASEQYAYIHLMFSDIDGDGLADFWDMHTEHVPGIGKVACCTGYGYQAFHAYVWPARKNAGYGPATDLYFSGPRPVGLTPLPFNTKQGSAPLFALAYEEGRPNTYAGNLEPSSIALFQGHLPMETQRGALRGGPLRHLSHDLVVMDNGARLLYATEPETPGDSASGGLGVLNVDADLAFFDGTTASSFSPVKRAASPALLSPLLEFLRGDEAADALGRQRRPMKFPRTTSP